VCFTHFLSSDPDPDPDPKTEHTPNAPPLGEHCAQVWFNSIQPSRRSSVLRVSHFITLFWLSDPDPDPDPKTEHNPDAPPLGEHCVQVWFKSIQPSRRSSIFSQLWTTDGRRTTDRRHGMTIPHMAFGQMS
jgi:hypothetical protein